MSLAEPQPCPLGVQNPGGQRSDWAPPCPWLSPTSLWTFPGLTSWQRGRTFGSQGPWQQLWRAVCHTPQPTERGLPMSRLRGLPPPHWKAGRSANSPGLGSHPHANQRAGGGWEDGLLQCIYMFSISVILNS